jgi:hypothetical protein
MAQRSFEMRGWPLRLSPFTGEFDDVRYLYIHANAVPRGDQQLGVGGERGADGHERGPLVYCWLKQLESRKELNDDL